MDEDITDNQLTVTTDTPNREAAQVRPSTRSELVQVRSRDGGSIAISQQQDGSMIVVIHPGTWVHVVRS